MGILDDNMNGKIEMAELRGGARGPVKMLKTYFGLIDTNHDGGIDAKEMAAAAKLMPKRSPTASVPLSTPTTSPVAPVASR